MTTISPAITIRTRGVLEIEGEELARCRELTHQDGRSLMRDCIDELRADRPERALRSVAILAADDEQILGWCLLFENRFGRIESYYFVDPAHRRRGVGRRLAEEVRALRPRHKVLVRPYDGGSYAFFANFPKFVPQGSFCWLEEMRMAAESLDGCPVSG
jgi:GNAT superfamily N-acetyltransferase